MARITCEDCLEEIGVKQHRQGEPFLVEGKNQEIVMTLREIAAGEVSMSNIEGLPDKGEDSTSVEESEQEVTVS